MLSELPIELLQDIGDQLRKTDQKRLRAVCKDLRLAMNPLFFSDLVLDTQSLHLNEGIQLLTALASGKTAWTPFAKSVTIRPLKWQDNVEGDRSDDAMEELFDAALGSLKNVRSVMWDVQLGDPAWQYDAILRFLGTAPLLGAFELCAGEVAVLILAQLISLRRKLKIKENLALTSLHLYDTDILAELWPWIQETTSWRLMVINAAYSPQLIAYISSYSGLQKLALRDPEEGDPHRFWRDVLPLHAASLVELVCRPSYECAWSFNADMVDTISQLRRLTYLEMSVNKADIAEPVNAVSLLLRTAAALPTLQRLTISSAAARRISWRVAKTVMRRRNAVHGAIAEVVQNFRGNRPSRVVVCVGGGDDFELKPVDEADLATEGGIVWAYQHVTVPEGG